MKIKIILSIGLMLVIILIISGCIKTSTPPICGNNIIEEGETSKNCCRDVGCPKERSCENDICVDLEKNKDQIVLKNITDVGGERENVSEENVIGYGVPASPGIFTFTQPNNNTFQGKIFGDECAHWVETLDGYTIIRNSSIDYWTYALNGEDITLVSSNYIVTIADPNELNLTKHLAPKENPACRMAR